MAAGGATRSLPAEMIERECNVRLEGFGFVPDTGGAGEYRGALSVFRTWRFTAPGRAMLRNCRVSTVPYGLAGGADGTSFGAELRDATGTHALPPLMMIDEAVADGTVLHHVQPGGGGYGDPKRRDPVRVLEDVLDEKLTRAYARDVYGVVITDAGTIDAAETSRLRQS